ncbi:hypothetical protein GQ607_001004 [Colletotrichum asianum]|uniref:Uncharacterized protein n=1 Tax=Colletotrichum asianum TaxID=702518 RepID=A0A8H3ZTE1_9PEZI|nr:hypothetical protein GQ607_001004 [Colletotrichum asianum]
MHFSRIILAITAAAGSIQASNIAGRQTEVKSDADCCTCDYDLEVITCKVSDAPICNVPDTRCPFRPSQTEELCCCCDPNPNEPAMKCVAQEKGAGCICPAVVCPFNFNQSMLPSWFQT